LVIILATEHGTSFDHSLWHPNGSAEALWSSGSVSINLTSEDPWAGLTGADFYDLMQPAPPPGIECSPAPGKKDLHTGKSETRIRLSFALFNARFRRLFQVHFCLAMSCSIGGLYVAQFGLFSCWP